MRYFKVAAGGYIEAFGIGLDGAEITKTEYEELRRTMAERPEAGEGYDYRLKDDLIWERREVPVVDADEEEIDGGEAVMIITGGMEA